MSKWLSHALRSAPRLLIKTFPKFYFKNFQRQPAFSALISSPTPAPWFLDNTWQAASSKHKILHMLPMYVNYPKSQQFQRHAITTNPQQRGAFGTTRH